MENIHTYLHTEENLDLSKEGDTQNLITYLILKEKERIRNSLGLYILGSERSVLVCLYISTR